MHYDLLGVLSVFDFASLFLFLLSSLFSLSLFLSFGFGLGLAVGLQKSGAKEKACFPAEQRFGGFFLGCQGERQFKKGKKRILRRWSWWGGWSPAPHPRKEH